MIRLAAAIFAIITYTTGASAFDTKATAAYVIDQTTGTVLLDKNADTPLPPASMSKLMTLYMAFEAIRRGKSDGGLDLNEDLPGSPKWLSRILQFLWKSRRRPWRSQHPDQTESPPSLRQRYVALRHARRAKPCRKRLPPAALWLSNLLPQRYRQLLCLAALQEPQRCGAAPSATGRRRLQRARSFDVEKSSCGMPGVPACSAMSTPMASARPSPFIVSVAMSVS